MVEQRSGKGNGKHRLPAPSLPAAGMISAGVVLLATSAASSPGPVDAARAVDPDRGPVGDHIVPPAAPRPMVALPGSYYTNDTVVNVDDSGAVIPTVFTGDIPVSVLKAYQNARDLIKARQPGCHLPLELLEAIGKVETNHARHGLVDTSGRTLTPILGPVLDGNGFAAIPDTDRGRYDNDEVWDRAVGPMQFIPSTWAGWAADGNGDHLADPHNVYDASLAAVRYLCAANRDLGTPAGLSDAIFSYNHSTSYRNLVTSWMSTYAGGTVPTPDATPLDMRIPQIPALAMIPPATPMFPAPETPAVVTPPPASTPPVSTPPTSTPPTSQPPTSQPPTSQPPTTEPPTTTPPTSQPPTTTPPAPDTTEPTPAPPTTDPVTPPPDPSPTDPVTGLVGGVTGLVGGLVGGLTGGSSGS